MICNSCNPVIVSCCSEQLIIGTDPNSLINYWIVIEDITNGRKIILPTSKFGGYLHVDISEQNFAENHSYEMYLCKADMLEKVSWEIGTESVDCLQVNFNKYYDSSGHVIIIDPQIIQL